jgi:hypothetical protein
MQKSESVATCPQKIEGKMPRTEEPNSRGCAFSMAAGQPLVHECMNATALNSLTELGGT